MHVVIIDMGVKRSILKRLQDVGCHLTSVPPDATCEEILALAPDGVFLSNGPGDPAQYTNAIRVTEGLLRHEIPLFGICLGHQILALASGAKTVKMRFGHHGANHPILDVETKKVYLSSQNHNFVVSEKDLPSNVVVTHRSLFDQTIAGIRRSDKPAFGFQGHPEGSPGPHDLYFLFEQFIACLKEQISNRS